MVKYGYMNPLDPTPTARFPLAMTIHPDGRIGEFHEHQRDLHWSVTAAGDLRPGDVVRLTVTDTFRKRTSQELRFFAGVTGDGRAVVTRTFPDMCLDTCAVLSAAQLTRIFRPQGRHEVLHEHGRHFLPWQVERGARLHWLPEVAAPLTAAQGFDNGRGVVLRAVGTDILTGETILKADDLDCHFGMTAAELQRLRAL